MSNNTTPTAPNKYVDLSYNNYIFPGFDTGLVPGSDATTTINVGPPNYCVSFGDGKSSIHMPIRYGDIVNVYDNTNNGWLTQNIEACGETGNICNAYLTTVPEGATLVSQFVIEDGSLEPQYALTSRGKPFDASKPFYLILYQTFLPTTTTQTIKHAIVSPNISREKESGNQVGGYSDEWYINSVNTIYQNLNFGSSFLNVGDSDVSINSPYCLKTSCQLFLTSMDYNILPTPNGYNFDLQANESQNLALPPVTTTFGYCSNNFNYLAYGQPFSFALPVTPIVQQNPMQTVSWTFYAADPNSLNDNTKTGASKQNIPAFDSKVTSAMAAGYICTTSGSVPCSPLNLSIPIIDSNGNLTTICPVNSGINIFCNGQPTPNCTQMYSNATSMQECGPVPSNTTCSDQATQIFTCQGGKWGCYPNSALANGPSVSWFSIVLAASGLLLLILGVVWVRGGKDKYKSN